MFFRKLTLWWAVLPMLSQAQSQLCVPVPTPGQSITQQTLNEIRKRGALAPGVSAFASLEAFGMAFGGSLPYIPDSATDNKFWADFATEATTYVTIDGSLDTSDVATWSDFSMQVYGVTLANFYRDRATAKDPAFRYIPRFKRFTVSQPRDMNMRTGVGLPGPRTVTRNEAPYPLARISTESAGENGAQWSWPRSHILMYDSATGHPVTCDYQEYGRAFPIVTTVSVGGSAGGIRVRSGITPEGFLSSVGAALFGAGSPAERAAKIITFLEVQ